MDRSSGRGVFSTAFWIFVGTAVVWLVAGLLPSLATLVPAVHAALHRWGEQPGLAAEVARNIALTSHSVGPMWQVAFDFVFSALNLAFGIILIRLHGEGRSARLLAVAVVGTSVAFNLRGHDALQVFPAGLIEEIGVWHVALHITSGLCYMFALLLFPDDRLPPARGWVGKGLRAPVIIVLGFVFTMLSLMTSDDHTVGLVVLFGMAVPVLGLLAQLVRYVRAEEDTRQRSRVVLGALVIALAVAIPLMVFTTSPEGETGKTLAYEVRLPAPGLYYFRCDPHPDTMEGYVEAGPSRPNSISMLARNNRFDQPRIFVASDEPVTIEFTNADADLHNVAIYDSRSNLRPIFVGAEFSGVEGAAFAFRTFRLVFLVIPASLLVGLIRFRLWDFDLVLNRTLAYGALVAVIAAVYLGSVIGIGALAGARFNLLGATLATAVVALAFHPLRARARRLADRLVYGERASPFEVLSQFSERIGGAYDVQRVLPEMASILGRGVAAATTEVWLMVDGTPRRAAAWPEDAPPSDVHAHDGAENPERVERAIPVEHHGETLGVIVVTKPRGEAFTAVEERLLQDVAGQAALVLKNAQLTAQLTSHLEELRASRQRIVTAQDAERRRIERDIHDGAQQHLVAMSMKLGMAREAARSDPDLARSLIEEIQADAEHALQTLRDLARGIYPPILGDRGLVEALEAHARRLPARVVVRATGVGRYEQDIENAVYFCCLEAIQNAVKHGREPITVTLEARFGILSFVVEDRGEGFRSDRAASGAGLQNMADRVAALGGELSLGEVPGGGARVAGELAVSERPR